MKALRLTWARAAIGLVVLLLAGAALVAWLNVAGEEPLIGDAWSFVATPEQVARGAYLARAGNCGACHTDRGGAAFAGGKGIATPFGTVFASNLTPDAKTGIGSWSAAQFWRALHNGRSADGRLLYPAFPYPNFTEITRADSDALYAWLRSQVPVTQVNRPHSLRFPYNLQASLASSAEAGVADWSSRDVAALLKTGLTPRGAALGPMAEVVFRSTQYLNDTDIAAMTEFLRSLPQTPPHTIAAVQIDPHLREHGEALYKDRCAACHGAGGEGGAGPDGIVYAPLAGNRKVLLETPANLIHIVVNGGFPPTTAGDPRPYGMPPFGPSLKDEEIAVLATYVRNAWGNSAPAVSALDVLNAR